ncbi:hypothetical protein ART_0351 [Arthrobacter sp. PAMC 25486]|nr:hypothetical protein ART_0351 [Arthrobacter sp. PAMC 25486]
MDYDHRAMGVGCADCAGGTHQQPPETTHAPPAKSQQRRIPAGFNQWWPGWSLNKLGRESPGPVQAEHFLNGSVEDFLRSPLEIEAI